MDNIEKKNELIEKNKEQKQLEIKRRADADRIAGLRRSEEKHQKIEKTKTEKNRLSSQKREILRYESKDVSGASDKRELSDQNKNVYEAAEKDKEKWVKKQLEGVRLSPDEISRVRMSGEIDKSLKEKKIDFEKQIFIKKKDASDAGIESINKQKIERIKLSPDEIARFRGSSSLEKEIKKITPKERLEKVTESLKNVDQINQNKWETIDTTQRRVALEKIGRHLRDAYECPDPPLIEKNFPEYDGKTLLGFYQDGSDKNNIDSDYNMVLNERLLNSHDVKEAVKTYCHEYRHAYQLEMVNRYKKHQFENLVHDKNKAEKWHQNFKDYKHPSDDYEQYLNQAVEKDAHEFSELIVRQLYENDKEK